MPIPKPRKSSPALVTAMAEVMVKHLQELGDCTDIHLQEAGFTPRQIADFAGEARAQAASARKVGAALQRSVSP